MALHYLALGDSYTIGEGVAAAARWPQQLVELLRAEQFELAPARLVATTGWTTDELAEAMRGQRFEPPYDLVSLLIGVNNQYRGRPLEEYRQQFTELLDWAILLAGSRAGRVLVLSIPDWGVTPFALRQGGRDPGAIGQAIDQFNAVAAAQCHRRGASWLDITGLSRQPGAALADDGLHPGAAQYALWARAALPLARDALG